LDLAGGLSVVYKPTPLHGTTVNSGELNTTISIMRNRVDGSGVSGAQIGTQGNDIVVQIPGIKNYRSVLNLLGQTALLEFRPVLCAVPAYSPPAKGAAAPGSLPSNCPAADQDTAANLDINTSTGEPTNNVPPDSDLTSYPTSTPKEDADTPDGTVLLAAAPGSGYGSERFLLGPLGPHPVTGADVASAAPQLTSSGQWTVLAKLTGQGSTNWDDFSEANFHQMIAIDLGGQVESAPLTQPSQSAWSSFDGSVQISGNFTEATADSLAQLLEYGALPVSLQQENVQAVSPTLGKSSLKAGLIAGLAGLALVLLYVIGYYRALGLVVVTGLALTAALLWAIVSALSNSGMNLTLDLAGVTGLIVSIGITVDSYIVYFERLKDDARSGRSVRSYVDKSFAGAFRTVLAADSVSFIGALVLYWLAIGPVRGFAFFLGLSTVLDVFTTFFFTRPLVILLGRNRGATEAKVLGVARGLALDSGASA
jgi:preprotein translocase subunit SecD